MQRIAVVAILGLLLSGCFASDRPMFAPETAVRALGDGGKYKTFERVDGKDTPSDPMVVRPNGANGYDFINEKGAATPVTFHAIPGGLLVAQVTLDGAQGYGYMLARIEGAQVLVMPAECGKQDKARMQALGVVERTQYECRIDKVADPVAFFAGIKPSPISGTMIKE